MIIACIRQSSLPVYGDGSCTRDWLFVEDHVRALASIIMQGQIGEIYNIASQSNRSNLDVVHAICDVIQREMHWRSSPRELVSFVDDRPGHDKRYVVNSEKIRQELGWQPTEQFESGLRKTIKWYVENEDWWAPILDKGVGSCRLGLPGRN
jgi:dTDP-glucose 4,6-dehydratase